MLNLDRKIYLSFKRGLWRLQSSYNHNIYKVKYFFKYFFTFPEIIRASEDLIPNLRYVINQKNDYIKNVKASVFRLNELVIDDTLTAYSEKHPKDLTEREIEISKSLDKKYTAQLEDIFYYGGENPYGDDWETEMEDQQLASFGGPDYPYYLDEIREDTEYLQKVGLHVE